MSRDDLEVIKGKLRKFAELRDWDQYHSPKNLAMALAAEVGELVECFQWLKEEETLNLSKVSLEKVSQEVADIQIYLIRLSDKLGIDLLEAVENKIKLNEERYPAEKVRGSAKKYTEYE